MLVLSRDAGERILIRCGQGGPLVSIEVVELRGRHVRVGIEAPDDYVIFRPEVAKYYEEESE